MSRLKLFKTIILIAVLYAVGKAQKRINGGQLSEVGKPYVVYLIKAPESPMQYNAWLCGGSIVSTLHIITSAACVEDVQYMYAISGKKQYRSYNSFQGDTCIEKTKKKIVYSCVPKSYQLDYEKIEKWAYIDLAVVKVESPYNFNDATAYQNCDYLPNAIQINYESKHQEPGIDAMVLGWGHQSDWRKPEDNTDLNNDLRYASTVIQKKTECKEAYKYFNGMGELIEKYMICTLGSGNINEKGYLISTSKPMAEGCTPQMEKLMFGDLVCEEDETIIDDAENPEVQEGAENLDHAEIPEGVDSPELAELPEGPDRDDDADIDKTRKNIPGRKILAKMLELQQANTRKQGICQNDHGGPLVTWVGGHEVLIGVASVFRVSKARQCVGPYLFTSTQCNGAFINCVINDNATRRIGQDLCDKPPEVKGFDTIARTISWRHHPDGPADNERFLMRPVIPINEYIKRT